MFQFSPFCCIYVTFKTSSESGRDYAVASSPESICWIGWWEHLTYTFPNSYVPLSLVRVSGHSIWVFAIVDDTNRYSPISNGWYLAVDFGTFDVSGLSAELALLLFVWTSSRCWLTFTGSTTTPRHGQSLRRGIQSEFWGRLIWIWASRTWPSCPLVLANASALESRWWVTQIPLSTSCFF